MTSSPESTGPRPAVPPEAPEGAFLSQAVALALDNVAAGREPFGAVVVRGGEVVGTGVNLVEQDADPTAHAEVAAVRAAALHLGTQDLTGATVYCSCEPCAMCHTVCTVAGVRQLVYAAPKEFVIDPDAPPRPDLVQMQAALRALAGDAVRYAPVPGADEPFRRFAERRGSRL